MVGQTSPASTFFVNEFFFPSEKLKQTKYSFYIYLTGPINLQLSFSAYLKDFHSLGSYILILHCYSKLSKRKKRKKGQGEEEEKDETWWPLQGEKGEVDLQSLKVQVCELVVEVSSSRFFFFFFSLLDRLWWSCRFSQLPFSPPPLLPPGLLLQREGDSSS